MSTQLNTTTTTLANISFLNKESNFQETHIVLDAGVGLIVLAMLIFLGILVLMTLRCNRGSNTQSGGNAHDCADEYIRDVASHVTSGGGELPGRSNDVNVAVLDVTTTQINCREIHSSNESHNETASRHQHNDVIDRVPENGVYSEIQSNSLSLEIESSNLYSEAGSLSVYSEVESHNVYSEAGPHYSEGYVEHSNIRQYQNIDSFHIEGYITITDHNQQIIHDLDYSHDSTPQFVNSNKPVDSSRVFSSSQDTACNFEDPRSSNNYVFPSTDISISPDRHFPETDDFSAEETNYLNVALFNANSSQTTELKLEQE